MNTPLGVHCAVCDVFCPPSKMYINRTYWACEEHSGGTTPVFGTDKGTPTQELLQEVLDGLKATE